MLISTDPSLPNGSKVRSLGRWAAATCAAPPSVTASQYYTPLRIVNSCWSLSVSGGI